MNTKMPIGVDDFKKVVENYYFVDKSDFIKDIIDYHTEATLITRPRRFGKTLNMSMLEYYFSIDKKQESKNLFNDLKISKCGYQYQEERNKYPVVFLSLKEIAGTNWDEMQKYIAYFLAQLYLKFNQLQQTLEDQQEKDYFEKIKFQKGNIAENANAIKALTAMLKNHYNKKVIVLIDEYDAPIQKAWENGFYKQAIPFFRELLSNTLKGNPSLNFAVLTGVLRIAKESIFSGLNNVDTCSITSERYDSAFGFTKEEIQKICSDLKITSKIAEIKEWYDGYCFGKSEIYNPWSVISYVAKGCVAKPYWINTSGNSILKYLISKESKRNLQLRNLLESKNIKVSLNEGIVYDEIGKNTSALYTLLLITGYLTINPEMDANYDRVSLKIPNEEIKWAYCKEILERLIEGVDKEAFEEMFDHLIQRNEKEFQKALQTIIQGSVSAFDVANKECFYHGFMLGIAALFLSKKYEVLSNGESGFGRFDIELIPKNFNEPAIIMEFKVSDSESNLRKEAINGLNQVKGKKYYTNVQNLGIKNIWGYGISFYKKKVEVKSRTF